MTLKPAEGTTYQWPHPAHMTMLSNYRAVVASQDGQCRGNDKALVEAAKIATLRSHYRRKRVGYKKQKRAILVTTQAQTAP